MPADNPTPAHKATNTHSNSGSNVTGMKPLRKGRLSRKRAFKTRVIPGGKDFYSYDDPWSEDGERVQRPLESLASVILQQMKACGFFNSFTLYMADKELCESIQLREGAPLKRFAPIKHGNQWDKPMVKEEISQLVAKAMQQYPSIMKVVIDANSVRVYIDPTGEFNDEAETFFPNVMFVPSKARKSNSYNAAEEIGKNKVSA